MRIAVLTNAYPPGGQGGASRIAFVYNELFAKRGHEVRVWGPVPAFAQLGVMDMLTRLFFHLRDLIDGYDTAREIIAWKPDVLLTHNLTGCGFAAPRFVREGGIRWVHVLHDVQLVEPSGQIRAGAQYRTLWRRVWSALRHTAMGEPHAVVSPTKWLLDFHRGFGWFKQIPGSVIPNPGSPHPLPLSFVRRGEQVLFVGRLDADKGVRVLLDAWIKLGVPEAKLSFIGSGSLESEIREANIRGVEVLGQQSEGEVARAMSKAAVVVVPSLLLENQPTVILEALAAGCNVVASDVGGVRETLGSIGWIVPPGNADALADAIREALATPPVDTGGAGGVLARHDPDGAADALVDVLKSNLNTRS